MPDLEMLLRETRPAPDPTWAKALDRKVGPGASVTKRAEHALADPAPLRALAAGAGFRSVSITTETRIVRFASVARYVRVQLTATPLASLLRQHGEELVDAVAGDVATALRPYQYAGGLAFPQEAHVLVASA